MRFCRPSLFVIPILLLVTMAYSGCGLTEQSKTENSSNEPSRAATPVAAETARCSDHSSRANRTGDRVD